MRCPRVAIDAKLLVAAKVHLRPIFEALARAVAESELKSASARETRGGRRAAPALEDPAPFSKGGDGPPPKPIKRAGRPQKPVIEFPDPLEGNWNEPDGFGAALCMHAERHGETVHHLYNAVVRPEDGISRSTLFSWARGDKAPRSVVSLEILRRIERRYRLPEGYFAEKAANPSRAATGHDLEAVSPAERRRLAWHLPDDFNRRPRHERAEILEWVRSIIISGATDYRRYQAAAMRQRYAVRFACAAGPRRKSPAIRGEGESGVIDASAQLNGEMAELLKFKTATFAAFGLQRNGMWGAETASQKIEHFGLWFGAFAAPPQIP
jgi:hypothetical protein